VDAKSQQSKDPYKVLEAHEREKKKKLLEACLKQQRRHFFPFVVSRNSLLSKESCTCMLYQHIVLYCQSDCFDIEVLTNVINNLRALAVIVLMLQSRLLCWLLVDVHACVGEPGEV
jgi:hypothetical protein